MKVFEHIAVAVIVFGVSASSLASESWWEANNAEHNDPVNTLQTKRTKIDEERFMLETQIRNLDSFSKKCDIVTYLSQTNGDSYGVEKSYVEGQILEAYSTHILKNEFFYEDPGSGFRYIPASLRVEYSCVGYADDVDPMQIPMPTTLCDPDSDEAMGCGNTCQASRGNPAVCASDLLRWNDDFTRYIPEEGEVLDKLGRIEVTQENERYAISIEMKNRSNQKRVCEFDALLNVIYTGEPVTLTNSAKRVIRKRRSYTHTFNFELSEGTVPVSLLVKGYCMKSSEQGGASHNPRQMCSDTESPSPDCIKTCQVRVNMNDLGEVESSYCE